MTYFVYSHTFSQIQTVCPTCAPGGGQRVTCQECKAQSALRGVCMYSSSHVHGTGTIFHRLFHRYCRFSIPELSELKFIFSLLVFVGTGLIAVSFTEPYQTDTIVPGQLTPGPPRTLDKTNFTLRGFPSYKLYTTLVC